MIALAVIAGTGVGLGCVLVLIGLRGTTPQQSPWRSVRSHLDHRHIERMNLRLGIAIGAAIAVGLATGWPVGTLLAAVAGWGLPALLSGTKAHKVTVAHVEAIASWAEMLRDTLAGAAGLEQAISATASVAPLAIRNEVAGLAASLEDEPLAGALRRFADEVADPTCDLVVAALVLASEHQASRLGDLLGTLAQAARDQAAMRLRVEAGRARTRTSVKVIVGTTVALCLILTVLDAGFLAPYSTPVGQVVLLVIGLIFTTAFLWLTRMTRPTTPERFLAPETGRTGIEGKRVHR